MNNLPREETGQYINLKALSDLTYTRLERLCEEMDWHPLRHVADPEHVLLLIERLEHCDDDACLFPKGKWATIQRIKGIFEEGFYKSPSKKRNNKP